MRDVIVIGGGPAGSTAATLLAQADADVLVLEREHFPRFHIGESLLPGSNRIFKRLGVWEQLHERFVRKPGGKWMYADRAIRGDFSICGPNASFQDCPYSFMVERDRFDQMLLENASAHGAEVRHGYAVQDLLFEGQRVAGVKAIAPGGGEEELRCRMLLDCSGQRAVVGRRLNLLRSNHLDRMAVFGHFEAELRDPDLQNGWFWGQLIEDGWVWLIPLGENKVSVGAVVSVSRYRAVAENPESFLCEQMRSTPALRAALGHVRAPLGKVRTTGNMGYTCERLAGEGWILAGDAALFVDPCYSSGVYLAMCSAERAADALLPALASGDFSPARFRTYERAQKRHESSVIRMVELFYLATNNRFLCWLIPRLPQRLLIRRFGTFIGGDFTAHRGFIRFHTWLARLVAKVAR